MIDQRVGRRFAHPVSLKVKGTLGVLLEGMRRGFIDDLQPLLDMLVARGTWIAPTTFAEVLKLSPGNPALWGQKEVTRLVLCIHAPVKATATAGGQWLCNWNYKEQNDSVPVSS